MKKPRKGTHAYQLLEYLAAGNEITKQDYFRMFGAFDLTQRVHDLKKKYGVPIKARYIKNPHNPYSKIAVYYLERE